MTGILNVLVGLGGISTSTFNFTAGAITGSPPSGAGYSDHSAGTEGGSAGGSITGGTLGPRHIVEIWSTSFPDSRLMVKGFTSDPGQSWLTSLFMPVTGVGGAPVTVTGAAATYSYDATNGVAKWLWGSNPLGITNGQTYNSNTITHGA